MRHNFVSKCPNASAVSALRPVTGGYCLRAMTKCVVAGGI
jgi:hypothetical protein